MWNWILLTLLYSLQIVLAYLTWPNSFHPIPSVYSTITIFGAMFPFYLILLIAPPKKVFWLSGLSFALAFSPLLLNLISVPSNPFLAPLFKLLAIVLVFIYAGLLSRLAKQITSVFIVIFPLSAACLMVTFQFFFVRVSPFAGLIPYPVLMEAYPLAHAPALIQMASFTGYLGLEFLVAFISACAAFFIFQLLLILPKLKQVLSLPETLKPLSPKYVLISFGIQATVLVLLGGLFIAGNQEGLHVLELQKNATRFLTVAQLQPNYDVSSFNPDSRSEEIRAVQLFRKMCLEAAAQKIDLIIFPENILSGRVPERQEFWNDLRSVLREVHIPSIVGLVSQDPTTKKTYNLWYFVDANGNILDYYAKRILFPFGEYIPLRVVINPITRAVNKLLSKNFEILKITATESDPADFTPGTKETLFALGDKKFSLKICSEMLYPQLFREGTARGAEVIFSPATNNWYIHQQGNHQYYLCTAIFRAIETRRWIGRTLNMGCAYYVDAVGNLRSITTFNQPQVHVYKVPLLDYQSFYVRHGDVFAWICVTVAGLLLVASFIPAFRNSTNS